MIINLVISNFKRSNDSPSSSMDTFKRATTRRRISSIRSSIPKASKTLFGKRWKRTVEQNATNCLRQVPLWLSKAFRILLFALVWYRYLFEIFHHFRYLKSKYPESIANHHSSVSASSFLSFHVSNISEEYQILQWKFTFVRIIHAQLLNNFSFDNLFKIR